MSEPIVETKLGSVRGKVSTDLDGKSYYSFHGIPYAKPPVGELRFKAPQPAEPWTGIKDATVESDECLSQHFLLRTVVGSEDSLKLNVFTKDISSTSTNLKPVMVWIHGGGFTMGSSKEEIYGSHFLICEDIVLVSINYRLGIFGFLSLSDASLGVPGNAGLKDQVMALRWVQENIRQFNGDPSNVTIFGESAGSSSVHYLMLSPMARGLFHKAILQSGCASNIWAVGTRCAKELCELLGKSCGDEKGMLDVLRGASSEDLMKAFVGIKDHFDAYRIRPIGPVVEPFNEFEPSFLPEHPIDIILSGNYSKVPMIIGYNSREGLFAEPMMKEKKGPLDFEDLVPFDLGIPRGSALSKLTAAEIKEFFYGAAEVNEDNVDYVYQIQSDNFFTRSIHTTVKHHLNTSNSPIFFYRFSLDAQLNFYKKMLKFHHAGASHADELGYLFKTALTPELNVNSVEYLTVKRMTKLWTNFARKGDPNVEQPNDLVPVVWPKVEQERFHYLEINENLSVGVNPDKHRMLFWEKIYSRNPKSSKL